jgi:arsenate reductase
MPRGGENMSDRTPTGTVEREEICPVTKAEVAASSGTKRVLFVCTHNSARSIMAEVLLRHHGGGVFEAFSAGTEIADVRPLTLRVLAEADLSTDGLRSKSTAELIGQPFDYVVTVCDSARETCPTFPGRGERLHWGLEDPAAATGSEEERLAAFQQIFAAIEERVLLFVETATGHDPFPT